MPNSGIYGRWWRKRRRQHLRQHPLCTFCLKQGKVVAANVADHIEPHRGDYHKLRYGALQSLCAACHNSIKARMESPSRFKRVAIGVDGYPIE